MIYDHDLAEKIKMGGQSALKALLKALKASAICDIIIEQHQYKQERNDD